MNNIITFLLIISIVFLYLIFKNKKNSNIVVKVIKNEYLKFGKQIIVVKNDDFSIEYKNFKKCILSSYSGNILVKEITDINFKELQFQKPEIKTPFILFVNNNNIVDIKETSITKREFYLALGLLKFGKTKAYDVAFSEDTDGRFCQKYEKFKNTPDGYFIDALSGTPLFDTINRYNSGTGWLSFIKPIEGTVFEIEDPKYGKEMIEIRAITSGIHLGHVFKDGLNGNLRYCINATVLEFIKKNKS
jgi:peptide methionine sulfoxide reductase msrA/msrB